MPIPFLVQLAVTVIMAAVAYALQPKPKTPKPEGVKDLEDPTAEAGRPVAKIWGTITVKDPNVLWFGDKSTKTYKVKV